MREFIAVMAVENGRVVKYSDFDKQASADAHVVAHNGLFVSVNPGGVPGDWLVDNASLVYSPQVAPLQERQERARKEREARYFAETDPMKNEIEREAYKSGVQPDLSPWIAACDQIKADIPIPTE